MSNAANTPAVPTFTHDCAECTYLGTLSSTRRLVDLYHCKRDRSLIVRFGEEGWDYSSLPRDMVEHGEATPELKLALHLARELEAPTLDNLRRVSAR